MRGMILKDDTLTARDFRLIRRARGLTLQQVSEQIGLDPAALSRIEQGKRPLRLRTMVQLVRVLFGEESAHRESMT